MKFRLVLAASAALAIAGCGSVQLGPTHSVPPATAVVPSVVASGSPSGSASPGGPLSSASGAVPSGSSGPESSASSEPRPAAGLRVLPCKLDTTRAEVCQQSVIGVTTQVSVGTRVFINVTVKNTSTAESAPISMLVTGPSVAPVLLTGVLGLTGCSGTCTHRVNTVTGTYEAQWPPIPAGATVTFTINLISIGQSGDVRTIMRLYAETMDDLEANALLASDPALIGEWQGIDTVLTP